ncbi:MAG: DUF2017 family protein [Actinobacteria bacterium]|nr:DUF2017 family protein [Actinomycetota bacterium]
MPTPRPAGGGKVSVTLDPGEAAVLAGLPDQVRELIEMGEGQVHDRLFPRAYLDPTEDEAEREWQALSHADLLEGRLEALEVFRRTLAGAGGDPRDPARMTLGEDEAAAWLGALNDLRLALGVLLEVTEDLDIAKVRPDDPRAPGLHLYGFLTWIQGELIDALSA